MGITWRFAMPLLSTLAALVIIVHSAEENLERDRQYDLRPRLLDTRPSDNEQPWRMAIRADPVPQQPAPSEPWNDSQEDPPIRRRHGRKRKRRPPALSDDDSSLKMTTLPDEEIQDATAQDSEPEGRRKKLRPNRWVETNPDTERPVRRRGQRRKRPSLNNWPELSEFGGYPINNKEAKIKGNIDDDDVEDTRDYYSSRGFDDDEYMDKELRPKLRRPVPHDREKDIMTKLRRPHMDDQEKKVRTKIRRPVSNSRYVITQETLSLEDIPLAKEDKSLSEFSMEVMGPLERSNTDQDQEFTDIDDKLREKSPRVFLDMDKAREQGPIDPLTLKEILKRSNGTSLSEILQQHNLTLADLLNGKENAIAVLKSEKILQTNKKTLPDVPQTTDSDKSAEQNANNKVPIRLAVSIHNDVTTKNPSTHSTDNTSNDSNIDKNTPKNYTSTNNVTSLSEQIIVNNAPVTNKNKENFNSTIKNEDQKLMALENRNSGNMVKRRFPTTIRRKLRMRPVNNTFKSQINRDLIALSARRYIHHNRKNTTKSKEWREMIPLMINMNTTQNQNDPRDKIIATTTSVPDETTMTESDEGTETTEVNYVKLVTLGNATEYETDTSSTEAAELTTITVEILATEMDVSVTERPVTPRPKTNASGLRQQAFNNRLKKKRLKHRTSTTEAPQDDIIKNLLEMGDLVSSSEFIARTQLPRATSKSDMETGTELEDFMSTEATSRTTNMNSSRHPSTREFTKSSAVTHAPLIISTEETAKIEIEEILNDTRTSAKLSKILKERNMTLSELLDHRERGSSHVHLADIFHNASREPNPPEPFLSKSLLEPISKETYPLRAILEANSHEQAIKVTTIDPVYSNHVNIPVIMDFGNNVNENAENMGIMSLFNNFTKETTASDVAKITLQQDSKGDPYKSTIIAVNATDDGDNTRESRMLNDDQDMISWNEIFSVIRRNQKNETKAFEKVTNELPIETYKRVVLEEDVDGDGLIVLEDLQHLKNTDKKVASGSAERIESNSYEGTENPVEPGILAKAPSSTKSVTVATASIVGLAMILFLLTYAALKWKQQRSVCHKKTFSDDRIPSPVFENRKIKKNCSSRSISPMLPTSNIYTMNTLESQTGKDSPEYMWDTLRKPFQ